MERKRGALALLAFLALFLVLRDPAAPHGLGIDLNVGPDGGRIAVSALFVRMAFDFGQFRPESDSRVRLLS